MSAAVVGILAATKTGMAIGAIAGVLPLVVGCVWRDGRGSLGGFTACVIAGAIGGLYAVIPVVVISTARTMGLTAPKADPNQSKVPVLPDEFGITIAMLFVQIFSLVSAMIVAGIYVIPFVLDKANCAPRSSEEGAIEAVVLFGSMIAGMLLGLFAWTCICRFFVSEEKRTELRRRGEARLEHSPPLTRRLFGALNTFIFPAN